jgi:hypothetical protein
MIVSTDVKTDIVQLTLNSFFPDNGAKERRPSNTLRLLEAFVESGVEWTIATSDFGGNC